MRSSASNADFGITFRMPTLELCRVGCGVPGIRGHSGAGVRHYQRDSGNARSWSSARYLVGLDAGVAMLISRQRLAIPLGDLSHLGFRNPSWQPAAVAEGDTCMARIRGGRGDTFRTELMRLVKKTLSRSGSWKPSAIGLPWIGATTALLRTYPTRRANCSPVEPEYRLASTAMALRLRDRDVTA